MLLLRWGSKEPAQLSSPDQIFVVDFTWFQTILSIKTFSLLIFFFNVLSIFFLSILSPGIFFKYPCRKWGWTFCSCWPLLVFFLEANKHSEGWGKEQDDEYWIMIKEIYNPFQLFWRQRSILIQGEHKPVWKTESCEKAKQDIWGFWMPGWLRDWFVPNKLLEGHSGHQLPSLWLFFPSFVSWICSLKNNPDLRVLREIFQLWQSCWDWWYQEWSENMVSSVCSQTFIPPSTDLPLHWRLLVSLHRHWHLSCTTPLLQRES